MAILVPEKCSARRLNGAATANFFGLIVQARSAFLYRPLSLLMAPASKEASPQAKFCRSRLFLQGHKCVAYPMDLAYCSPCAQTSAEFDYLFKYDSGIYQKVILRCFSPQALLTIAINIAKSEAFWNFSGYFIEILFIVAYL